ncbi:methionine--tRNA ligase [Mycoplasmoides alvi]|uniref:methionine--tRNA ligase n=1 Tax=Mycoplasmoides alvi TaxID=78580 RepID=UPI00051C36BC|nr:methionine--tRNA ligase [Mycoplasmoides alvi]
MNFKKKCFITTPIFYPSGKPHIGHAFTIILGDFLKRYKLQRNYDVFLLTGTDEHGKKIAEKALKENLNPQVFVDQQSENFRNLFNHMQISYDKFVRTTDDHHKLAVQKIFNKLYDSGSIFFDSWSGWYCVDCEENYSLTNATRKEDNSYNCAIGHKLISINEDSYFIKIDDCSSWIKNTLIQNEMNIYPTTRISELINNFLNVGLKDLSISRKSISWGIQVPINLDHTIYVWFDALFSYITGLNYLSNDDYLFQKFWNNDECEKIHLLSREITRFHCIYWPIFLKKLDLKMPTKFISHGWIIDQNGNKMSKSLNNVIDPNVWIDKYGNDAVRYYLLKEMSLDQDNRCGEKLLINIFNADLANNLGNLVNRTIGMLWKYQKGIILPFNNLDENELELMEIIKNLPDKWNSFIDNNKFKNAFDECLQLVYAVNKLIENRKPWELFKTDNKQLIANLLFLASATIRTIFVLLEPVLINKSQEVFKQMNFNKSMTTIESLSNISLISNILVSTAMPLFVRIIEEKNV